MQKIVVKICEKYRIRVNSINRNTTVGPGKFDLYLKVDDENH